MLIDEDALTASHPLLPFFCHTFHYYCATTLWSLRGLASMQVTKITGLIVAIIWVPALLLLNGCARRAVNGYFVADTTANQVVMIHIVEAPRGHLSGALVLSTLDPAGSQLDVSNYDATGSIAGNNVSLTITGGLATLGGWLGGGNILVGALSVAADPKLTHFSS